MEHPIVQKAIDKLTEAYKPIVEKVREYPCVRCQLVTERCSQCGSCQRHDYHDLEKCNVLQLENDRS